MPPHLLFVRDQRGNGDAEIGRAQTLAKVFVEHHLSRREEMRVLHQIFASQSALVSDRHPAVRTRLQEQVRIADAAAGKNDVLCGFEVKLLP